MLQEIFELTDEVLQVPVSSFDQDLEEDWNRIVMLHLLRAHQSLSAVRITSEEEWYAPSMVLIRYLFELAINLVYLEKDVDKRVPIYLESNRVMFNLEEADQVTSQLDDLWRHEDHVGIAKLLLPGKAWRRLKQICEELGLLNHYDTFYRHASEAAHGGAHGMATELLEHLGIEQRPQWETPGTLITALVYYGWIAEIACKTFPYMAESYQFGEDWGQRIREMQENVSEQMLLYR